MWTFANNHPFDLVVLVFVILWGVANIIRAWKNPKDED